ncbi:MAG: glycosyltransferase [Bacteroidota bacterium]|nr:glycosyltransferase [Bacteroidota bacterium]
MIKPQKILFLYSELAGYTVNCVNHYIESNPGNEIHIIRWPLNKEAPFKFLFKKNVFLKEKTEVNILDYVSKIKPNIIICSGWFDKEYLQVIKQVYKTITTVLMFDNYWEGSLKQKIGRFILPKKVTRYFNLAWVPGKIQGEYAKKIGFTPEQLFYGFYATDLSKFNTTYQESVQAKKQNYPKAFLYIGRYLTLKGIEDLWEAFTIFSKNNPDWELHCAGTGALFDKKVLHDKIIHHGFIQSEELYKLVKKSGVVIMPSHYDHWGMSLQEMTAAGLPVICSDTVGSASVFLEEQKNGFIHKAKNVTSLVEAMTKTAKLSTNKLLEFGKHSHKLSDLYTIETWSKTLNEILKKTI